MFKKFGIYKIYVNVKEAVISVDNISEDSISYESVNNKHVDFDGMKNKLNAVLNEINNELETKKEDWCYMYIPFE